MFIRRDIIDDWNAHKTVCHRYFEVKNEVLSMNYVLQQKIHMYVSPKSYKEDENYS